MGSPRRVEAMDISITLMSIASTLLGDPIVFSIYIIFKSNKFYFRVFLTFIISYETSICHPCCSEINSCTGIPMEMILVHVCAGVHHKLHEILRKIRRNLFIAPSDGCFCSFHAVRRLLISN